MPLRLRDVKWWNLFVRRCELAVVVVFTILGVVGSFLWLLGAWTPFSASSYTGPPLPSLPDPYALKIEPPIVVAEIRAGENVPLNVQSIERFLKELERDPTVSGALTVPQSPQKPGLVRIIDGQLYWHCELELLPSSAVQGDAVKICVRFVSPAIPTQRLGLYSKQNFISAWRTVDDEVRKAVLRSANELSPNVLVVPADEVPGASADSANRSGGP
jgi:hypothetical protein